MSKVVIVGISGSGKTCYFYGMLRTLMRGYNGFQVRVAPEEFSAVNTGIKRLGDIRLPLEERWPKPTSVVETYHMQLLYNFKELDSFDWVDYPGEILQQFQQQFVDILKDADCLLLCVGCEGIQGDMDAIPEIANDIFNYQGGSELNNAMMHAASNGNLPPVCIIYTKYDMASPELRSIEALEEISRQVFPVLFNPKQNVNDPDKMVTICPTTLGAQINSGGRLEPKNMEKPVCYANYLIRTKLLMSLNDQLLEAIKKSQEDLAAYNEMTFFRKLVTKKPDTLTEEQQQALTAILDSAKEDADVMKAAIEVLPLYLDGASTDWPA